MVAHKANPYEKGTERATILAKSKGAICSHKANPYEKGTESYFMF